MTTIEPNMEIVDVEGTVSGDAIIDDLCNRIGDRLSADCNLRATDCFQSYSASIHINLWLRDFDTAEINAHLAIGQAESAPPTQTVTLAVAATADQIEGTQQQNLERPIDPAGVTEDPLAAKRKHYTPTGNPRGRPRKYALQSQ